MPSSRFLFAVCQVGAEPLVKRELKELGSPAYQRPGLLTFKLPAETAHVPSFEPTFVRGFGLSLGMPRDRAELHERVSQIPEARKLHVFPRDLETPGMGAESMPGHAFARETEKALRTAFPGRFTDDPTVDDGDLVLDVVTSENEAPLVGWHVHNSMHLPWPGGRSDRSRPDHAPSRAYMKLCDALEWSGLEVRPRSWCLEIGAAPGGAVTALLERGAMVCAVDPRSMDPRVLANPNVLHLRKRIEQVHPSELPGQVELLAIDIGLSPRFAMHHLERVTAWIRRDLRGIVVTLKLNEPHFADELPDFRRRVESMGFQDVRIRQLGWNRKEVCLIGRMTRPRRS